MLSWLEFLFFFIIDYFFSIGRRWNGGGGGGGGSCCPIPPPASLFIYFRIAIRGLACIHWVVNAAETRQYIKPASILYNIFSPPPPPPPPPPSLQPLHPPPPILLLLLLLLLPLLVRSFNRLWLLNLQQRALDGAATWNPSERRGNSIRMPSGQSQPMRQSYNNQRGQQPLDPEPDGRETAIRFHRSSR